MTKVLERHTHPKYERLTLQLRSNSKFYQAVTYLDGKLVQKSLKTGALHTAMKFAEDWYRRAVRSSVQFGHQHPVAQLTNDPTVAEAFRSYLGSLEKRKKPEAEKRWGPIADYWRTSLIREVSPQTFKGFYAWRRAKLKTITPHTLHKDIVLVRQILKHAIEEEQITTLPLIPKPGKIEANPRPWLTRAEWGSTG